MVDQAGAVPMWIPDNLMFSSTDATWVVVHKTAGFQTAEDVANYFIAGSDGRDVSAHYVVGLDGTIVQCVPEAKGAGANCCLEVGHASYLPSGVNLNVKTISIEHVDPTSDNSTPVPPAQAAASFKLIHDICIRHNIPMRSGDTAGGVIGHNDIDPINRARCPGNYPWSDLWAYLKGGHMGVPNGWRDDGKTLTAPNGVIVTSGFRNHILNSEWDAEDTPMEKEYHSDSILLHNASVGAGNMQCFRSTLLWWTQKNGVVVEKFPVEELNAAYIKIKALQSYIDGIKNTPPAPPLDVKATANQAIAILQKLL